MLPRFVIPLPAVQRNASGGKPRHWHVTLVPSDDPEKVSTLKWLFQEYANLDIGLRRLAESLNERGVIGPAGGRWYMGTIREILKNESYLGRFVWAKRRMGKYHRVSAGEIKAREDGSAVRFNAIEERIVKEGAHEALIDAETFTRVQDKLGVRKRSTGYKAKTGDVYLLSGLVYCGHCGRKMYGSLKTRRKDGRVYKYAKYVCSTYYTAGTKEGCGCHSVDQGQLLEFLLDRLKSLILAGGHREALRDEVLAELRAAVESGPGQAETLRAKLAQMDRELDVAKRRFLRAPEDVADMLADELSTMRKQRDRVAAELAVAATATTVDNVDEKADAVVARLWSVAQEIDQAPPRTAPTAARNGRPGRVVLRSDTEGQADRMSVV